MGVPLPGPVCLHRDRIHQAHGISKFIRMRSLSSWVGWCTLALLSTRSYVVHRSPARPCASLPGSATAAETGCGGPDRERLKRRMWGIPDRYTPNRVLIPSGNRGIRGGMKIEKYSFGSIVIEGKTYTTDVVVFPDRVLENWKREEEHRPQISELAEIVKAEPELLIFGTGYAGVMSVADQIRNFLTSKGIEVRVEKTTKAVELYNSLAAKEKVIAALHITC